MLPTVLLVSALEVLKVFRYRTIYFLVFLKCSCHHKSQLGRECSFFNSKELFFFDNFQGVCKTPLQKTCSHTRVLQTKVRNYLKDCVTFRATGPPTIVDSSVLLQGTSTRFQGHDYPNLSKWQ